MTGIAFERRPKAQMRLRRGKEKNKCGKDEFFDNVVHKCSLCQDVCEAKIRLRLDCFECKGYVSQKSTNLNEVSKPLGMNVAQMTLIATIAPVILITIVVIALTVMGVKLYRQTSRINKRKKAQEASLSSNTTPGTEITRISLPNFDYELPQGLLKNHYSGLYHSSGLEPTYENV